MMIPQYTRNRLASSVVGTPGVDMSGARIGASISDAASQVGKAALSAAIQKQEYQNAIEGSTLQAELRTNLSTIFQKVQDQYANDPEKAVQAFQEQAAEAGELVNSKASNDKVKSIVGKRDPAYEGAYTSHLVTWASTQRDKLNVDKIGELGDKQARLAYETATDEKLSFGEQQFRLMTLLDAGKNLAAGVDPTHPERNQKFTTAIQGAIVKNMVDGYIDSNPARGLQLIDQLSNDPKLGGLLGPQLTQARKQMEEQLGSFQHRAEVNNLARVMVTMPDKMNKVMAGELTFGELEREDPHNLQPGTKELKQLSISRYNPQQALSAAEVNSKIIEFHNRAIQLGLEADPTTGKKVKDTKSLQDMIKLQTDVSDLAVVAPEQAKTLNTLLMKPLAMAISKAHSPNIFDQASKSLENVGKAITGKWGEMSWTDAYGSGYDTLNKYLEQSGDNSLDTKVRRYTQFITQMNDIAEAQQNGQARIDPNTNQPWTPQGVAAFISSAQVGRPFTFMNRATGKETTLMVAGIDRRTGMPLFKNEGAKSSVGEQIVNIK